MDDYGAEERGGQLMASTFQGSETTRAEVTFYQHNDDPILVTGNEPIPMAARGQMDFYPCLYQVSTQKALGAPSGNFSVIMKPARATESLLKKLTDDAWVDIVLYRHDQPWHVMRGLVDDIRLSRRVNGNGATVENFTVTGRDFAKVYEITPIWFSPYANDMVSEIYAAKIFQYMPSMRGTPAQAVTAFLEGFLEASASEKGPNWNPPTSVPGVTAGSFIKNVKINTDGYSNTPARKVFNVNLGAPQGTLWELAMQHADPLFCELYADLLPDGDYKSQKLINGDPLKPSDTKMTVVFRDRPFPVASEDIQEYMDDWIHIPTLELPYGQISSMDVGRSGLDRFNAYFCAPVMLQEASPAYAMNILPPLYDAEAIRRHGLRRMDIQSLMVPDNLNMAAMADEQRRILCDFYALNSYMLSGNISLGMGRPDIKIGCRVRIPQRGEIPPESYYVESVGHQWTFGPGLRTTLGVTRGWQGTDDSYTKALTKMSKRYKIPKLLDSTFDLA